MSSWYLVGMPRPVPSPPLAITLPQMTDGEIAWPKTTGSLHQKLSSFLPLGILGPQGTPGRHWAQGIEEDQTCPREACLLVFSPVPASPHPHFSPPSSHPPYPRAQHPLWALPPSQKPSSTPKSPGPRAAAGRHGRGLEGQWLLYSIQLNCSQTRLGVQLEGGCNHHGSA